MAFFFKKKNEFNLLIGLKNLIQELTFLKTGVVGFFLGIGFEGEKVGKDENMATVKFASKVDNH